MRDDASAKVRDANKRHECRVHVILFFRAAGFPGGTKRMIPKARWRSVDVRDGGLYQGLATKISYPILGGMFDRWRS